MKRLKAEIRRSAWYSGLVCTFLCLGTGIALPQGDVGIAFELTDSRVTANEPVYVQLSIDNRLGNEEVGFVPGDYSESYFDLFVTEPSGTTIRADTMGKGGLRHVGRISVPAGERFEQKLLISRWYQFIKPGDYKLTFQPSGPVRTASGETITFTPQELSLTVEPRDPTRLQEVCERLAKAAAGYSDYGALREAAETLGFVKDPEAIPYLARVLAYHNYVSEIAVKGLVRVGSPEALEVLKSNLASANPNLRTIIQGGIEEIESGPHAHTPN